MKKDSLINDIRKNDVKMKDIKKNDIKKNSILNSIPQKNNPIIWSDYPDPDVIRVGDKVINTKNNYKCINSDGVTTPVFNGNMGIVKEINDDGCCVVNFIGLGEIVFSRSDSKNLELAYACSTHKLQGSGFTSTIVGLDSSSYIMNNSELLYTAITRAKKYCVLVGNNGAVNKAIKTKEVKTKQTLLKDFLLENNYKIKERIEEE